MKFWKLLRELAMWTFVTGYVLFVLHVVWSWKTAPDTARPSSVLAAAQVQFPKESGAPDPNLVLAEVNRQRADRHLPALIADARLNAIAEARLHDMIAHQYYAHQSPAGIYYTDLFRLVQLSPDHSCENLNLTPNVSEYATVTDWLASTKGHRECMLNSNDTRAGYAAAQFDTTDNNGQSLPEFLVVAISSTDLN